MEQTIPFKSVRFFPHWNHNDTTQLMGLSEMINYILDLDPAAKHWIEIGSYIGESATLFLSHKKILKLDCIEQSCAHVDILKQKFANDIKYGRCYVYNEYSQNCASKFDDQSIDVVYIDGDHSYEAVKRDIELYYPKIKIYGFIAGHDYNTSWPGVIKAVDEFKNTLGVDMIKFQDSSWLIRKNA